MNNKLQQTKLSIKLKFTQIIIEYYDEKTYVSQEG